MYYIDKIREVRKKRGYSQKAMAELLETTQQQYSKYENKTQELPIRHLITICNHFDLSADWLLDLNVDIQRPVTVYDLIGNKPVISVQSTKEKKELG